jgi:predicted enzyme related to lactoylglutathione lyase
MDKARVQWQDARRRQEMKAPSHALVLYAADPKKTLAFYRAAGLTFRPERHDGGPRHHACDFGGFAIEIYRDTRRTVGILPHQPTSRMILYVADLEATRKKIVALGATCSENKASDIGPVFLAVDPDGRECLLIGKR